MLNVLFMLLPVGGACRARVILKLSKSFSSPIDASKKFEEICKTLFFTPQVSPIPIKTVVNPIMASSSNPIAGSSSGSSLEIASHDPLLDRIMQLSLDEQLELLGEVVSLVATKHFGCSISSDFIRLSMEAMKNLEEAGKKNIIYNLVLGFSRKRPDGSDCYFPIKRMPFGLLQYMSEFFNAGNGHSVSLKCLY